MNVNINMGKEDYFSTFLFGWAGITCVIIYAFFWDLHFLTVAIALFAISFLIKKATDWDKENKVKKNE